MRSLGTWFWTTLMVWGIYLPIAVLLFLFVIKNPWIFVAFGGLGTGYAAIFPHPYIEEHYSKVFGEQSE